MLAAETVITNAACAAAACIHIFVIVIYVDYFRLLRKTFDDVNFTSLSPRLMNINFQSRFSAQWNTPLRPHHV